MTFENGCDIRVDVVHPRKNYSQIFCASALSLSVCGTHFSPFADPLTLHRALKDHYRGRRAPGKGQVKDNQIAWITEAVTGRATAPVAPTPYRRRAQANGPLLAARIQATSLLCCV